MRSMKPSVERFAFFSWNGQITTWRALPASFFCRYLCQGVCNPVFFHCAFLKQICRVNRSGFTLPCFWKSKVYSRYLQQFAGQIFEGAAGNGLLSLLLSSSSFDVDVALWLDYHTIHRMIVYIFTYMYHTKSTIHVCKSTIPVDPSCDIL